MKTNIFILLTFSLSFAACQATVPTSGNSNSTNGGAQNSNQTAKPSPTATSDKPKIKTADGTGIVTKINTELGSVGLDHDEIKGIMPAMEGMEFYVSDVKMLDKLKIGDKVDFVLEDNAGAERIIRIKKRQ